MSRESTENIPDHEEHHDHVGDTLTSSEQNIHRPEDSRSKNKKTHWGGEGDPNHSHRSGSSGSGDMDKHHNPVSEESGSGGEGDGEEKCMDALNPLKKCCSAFFRTREMVKGVEDIVTYYRTTLMECLIFMGFILLLYLVVYGPNSRPDIGYTRSISTTFLGSEPRAMKSKHGGPVEKSSSGFHLSSIRQEKDLWMYLGDTLVKRLHFATLPSRRGPPKSKSMRKRRKRKGLNDTTTTTTFDPFDPGNPFITTDDYYYDDIHGRSADPYFSPNSKNSSRFNSSHANRIMRKARLRQIRVNNLPCRLDRVLRIKGVKCYPAYSPSYENKGQYHQNQTGPEWTYQPEELISGQSYWGEIAWYSGGGAVVALDDNQTIAQQLVDEIRNKLWTTQATRVVFLEATIYNFNLGCFCVVKLAWEFLVGGGIVPSWEITGIRFTQYTSLSDYFRACCEILLLLYTLYYTCLEIMELRQFGFRKYLQDVWCYFDVAILTLLYTAIFLYLYRIWFIHTTIKPAIQGNADYIRYDTLAYWEWQYWRTLTIVLFLAKIKIMKYFSINTTMAELSDTMYQCAKDLLAFSTLFLTVFLAYAQLGYFLFSDSSEKFQTIKISVLTMLRMTLGDFEYKEFHATNGIVGTAYFLSYIFFVFFVLVNMFLAIINDTYSDVKTEQEHEQRQYLMVDYIRENVLCWGREEAKTKRLMLGGKFTVEQAEGLVQNGKVTAFQLRKHLLKSDFTGQEVDLFLQRFELNRDHALDDVDTGHLIEHLEQGKTATASGRMKRKSSFGGGMSRRSTMRKSAVTHHVDVLHFLQYQRNEEFDESITDIETSIGTISSKLELVLSKLPQTQTSADVPT